MAYTEIYMDHVFLERYKKLNKKQKEAVDTLDGPLLVVAGPGSGKTELLSLRVGNILRERPVSPHNILCLTFTENGAINMRERLAALIGQNAYRVSIFTFHAFCNHIISRFPEYFWNATHFTQANDITKAELLQAIFASLPHGHPLASYHPEKGYVYLRDTADRIKHIKSYGYTAEEYKAVVQSLTHEHDAINACFTDWPARLSAKKLDEVTSIVEKLEKLQGVTSGYLAKTLSQAFEHAEQIGVTEPIASWKTKYLVKENDVLICKDSYQKDKLLAVAEIYESYSKQMNASALYDYDDMIIEVAHALTHDSVLRNTLEEQYQYVLIDEFQDTNEAQMSLVRSITSHPVHEGSPNVCVVGDDDQAIYKFQGAEVSHMMRFRDSLYKNVKTVVLDENYRSTQEVLDLSRGLITQIKGSGRLENKYEDITKVLVAKNKNLKEGGITITRKNSDVAEYAHVARSIRKALDAGGEPDEIAVLSRGHRELRALLPYLDRENIPYEYIKKANVFDEPHVKILIDVCEYIASTLSEEVTKEYLLPTILSYPCFSLERIDLFTLAVEAKERHVSWVAAMKESSIPKIQELHDIFASLSVEALTTPLEHILEQFMEKSGFKEFYFSQDRIKESPTTYVAFLASLKTFIESLREWKEGEVLFVSDVASFVQTHKDHDISLISESPFMKHEKSVQLLTSHASKGLEFEHVYVIACHDSLWTKSPRTNIAPLPAPLVPLMQPAGDTEDDFIRLLYVALTRAKHTLHISGHDALVRYLVEQEGEEEHEEVPIEAHENALLLHKDPFKEDEWVLLSRLVKNYKMPVTHLNNFLNLQEGGPLYFVEQNLLRFPQPMNPSGVYGSSIHKALEELVMYPKYNAGKQASLETLLATFSSTLRRGRLPLYEKEKQEERGKKVLHTLFEHKESLFKEGDMVEVDMKDEGVTLGEARLTGKIDLLRKTKEHYEVVDIKTGKAYASWDDAATDQEKIKLHMYRLQLIMYIILLRKSIHYSDLPVVKVSLLFVEEKKPISLFLDASEEELAFVEKLIEIVYTKITSLTFVMDLSSYGESYKGLLQFEKDLVEGKI
jgi:DNA helicase-2/ATP-dependent DNA helicase PcrA